MLLQYKVVASPLGPLKLVARGEALAAILWPQERLGELVEAVESPVLDETERQLVEYFAGRRQRFELPLDFVGTDFQREVWAALLTIPFGEMRSYADIARQLGKPKAIRAVGAANGRNPISIVAPCHRVVGSDGSLTGFAGGLDAKRMLLALERGLPAGW